MTAKEQVDESNRIEGIHRPPTAAEIAEHVRFITLGTVTVEELVAFVKVYQPDAELRDRPEVKSVRIGDYFPEKSGPLIRSTLANLLININQRHLDPFQAHVEYEMLHPFTDGNGRSGRALWYWMMNRDFHSRSRADTLGFLHSFYYQTLAFMQSHDD